MNYDDYFWGEDGLIHTPEGEVSLLQEVDEEKVISFLKDEYHLAYIGYQETLDQGLDVIQGLIDLARNNPEKALQDADEYEYEWWYEARHMEGDYAIQEALSDYLATFDEDIEYDSHPAIEQFWNDGAIDVRSEVFGRDTSQPLLDAAINTGAICVRFPLDNEEGTLRLGSSSLYGGKEFSYSVGMEQVVEALQLNPRTLYEALVKAGETLLDKKEDWPEKPERNSKELVDYEALVEELQETPDYPVQLTATAIIKLSNLVQKGFFLEAITIPKGNHLGFYDSLNGAGSPFNLPLKRDLTINVKANQNWSMVIDDRSVSSYGYSIQETYGVDIYAFGALAKLHAEAKERELTPKQSDIVMEAEQVLGRDWKREKISDEVEQQNRGLKL